MKGLGVTNVILGIEVSRINFIKMIITLLKNQLIYVYISPKKRWGSIPIEIFLDNWELDICYGLHKTRDCILSWQTE
jgi:hypothetical protein